MVRKHYSTALKAWIGNLGDGVHDGGPEDPRVCVIKVKALTAQYAISRSNYLVNMAEVAKGVVTGSAPQVQKLRHLNEQELSQCESFRVCSVYEADSRRALKVDSRCAVNSKSGIYHISSLLGLEHACNALDPIRRQSQTFVMCLW